MRLPSRALTPQGYIHRTRGMSEVRLSRIGWSSSQAFIYLLDGDGEHRSSSLVSKDKALFKLSLITPRHSWNVGAVRSRIDLVGGFCSSFPRLVAARACSLASILKRGMEHPTTMLRINVYTPLLPEEAVHIAVHEESLCGHRRRTASRPMTTHRNCQSACQLFCGDPLLSCLTSGKENKGARLTCVVTEPNSSNQTLGTMTQSTAPRLVD